MIHRHDRIAGAFDDNLDRRVIHQRFPIVAEVRIAFRQRVVKRSRRCSLGFPAHPIEVRARIRGREIGNSDQVYAGRVGNLRKKHRTEFARPDESDGERFALRLALQEFGVEVHFGIED
jgi:hypothetical protein